MMYTTSTDWSDNTVDETTISYYFDEKELKNKLLFIEEEKDRQRKRMWRKEQFKLKGRK